jgi:protocatechuate 3,4-dioxygenase beta subunit
MNGRVKLTILVVAAAVAGGVFLWRHKQGGNGSDTKDPAGPGPQQLPEPPRPAAGGVAIAVEPDADGTLLLEGQVIDAAEKPVADALVLIDTVPPRQAMTEADGGFSFARLNPREYALVASAGDAHAGPVYVRASDTKEPVILRMVDGSALEVVVRDAGSKAPVGGALVELRDVGTMTATTDGAGQVRLRGLGATNATLRVSASGYAPAARRIVLQGVARQVDRQVIDLVRGAPVSGRVIDPAGKPVAGARVLPDPVAEPFPIFDHARDAVVTDAQGAWKLPALAGGTYRFVAYHADFAETATAPTAIDGSSERTGIDIRMEPAAIVTGLVVDAGGAAVAHAEVHAVTEGGGIPWRLTHKSLSGADGRFRIAGLARAPADLFAAHNDKGSSALLRVDLGAKPEQEVELKLTLTGGIAGTVVTGSGEPVAEAQVMAEPEWTGNIGQREEWRARGIQTDIADSGGAFRFTGLPPGPYRVRAAHPGASEGSIWVHAGARATTGDTGVKVTLPAEGWVSGKVAYADGGAPDAFLVSIGGATGVAVASTDGAFKVKGVGGKQNVWLEGPQFAPTLVPDVAIPEAGTAELGTVTVTRGRSVSGRVVDSAGMPVAEATVAAGALLTGGGNEVHIPSESINAKATTTDAQGNFILTGFGSHPISVVAGHPQKGRSTSVQIGKDVTTARVELVLAATGGMEGVITRGGQPLPGTVVIAAARGAMRSMFFTISGKDGSYGFDQLGAESYLVQAMVGSGGGKPKDLHAVSVTVKPGSKVEADIDILTGPNRVEITVAADDGSPVAAASVSLLSIEIDAATMAEMREKGPPEGASGSMYIRMSIGGQPAIIEGIPPGKYTACATAIPVDPNDPQAMQKMSPEIVEGAPMKCVPAPVAAEPASQKVVVTVPAAWTKPK